MFLKKMWYMYMYFHLEISTSCTTQESENFTPHYPIVALLSSKWSIMGGYKRKQFQTFSSESGCSLLQEVPNIVVSLGNIWHFGKLVTEER